MKRYLISSIIAKAAMTMALAFFIPSTSTAQVYENTPVNISKEKVRIDGQVCYSHIVLEKQTLYSISKAYDVAIEDIYKYNPGLKENGLKKNSILIIPIIENEDKKEEAKPLTIIEKKTAPEIQKSSRKTHTVKWYEDIEGIAAKYGVSVKSIMKANGLTGRKLSKRQKLIIPDPGEFLDDAMAEAMEKAVVKDTTAAADSVHDSEKKGFFNEILFPKKEIDMSLLMPLKATGNASSRQNMDFYSGVLLAIYDMKKEGISTNLNVYDVADGKLPGSKEILERSDIIIGPVASADIRRTLDFVPYAKAVVSPLDPRAENMAYSEKAIIQAPTPHMAQYLDLVSWIREDMKPGDRVLVITEKGAKQNEAVRNMKAAIDSSGIEYKPISYSILEGRNVTNTLAYLMSETHTNRVYIASESEAFVNDVVRNLNVMIHQKYSVVLYAPSKIRGFETIEVENFHNTEMHVSLGYYIDYEDPRVKSFLLKYRALFNTEPTQFAFQGYDLARYFISHCSKYGNRWMEKLDNNKTPMLQSTFDFIGTPDGGYINNGVRRIIYGGNWTIERIR